MAWVRKLPSGLWAATVRLPNGRRRTETDRLKGVVDDWAKDLESDIRRGDWLDPHAAKTSIGELWEKYKDGRRLEKASRRRDESHWRCHVASRWADVRVGTILKPDVSAWVVGLEKAGTGAATIQGALGVLRALLEIAVDARYIRSNPARGVRAPERNAHLDRVLAPEEDVRLLEAMDRLFGDRPDARLMVELMLYHGLRWEEAGAVDREHVDQRKRLIKVGPVLERDGTIRPYPKSKAGERPVPIDEDVWPRLRERVLALPRGGLLVTGPEGKPLDYSRWHDRVWSVAMSGRAAYPGRRGHPARPAIPGADLADPRPTPHDLRHTYGTRLGEQRMPAHEIMALMGHESLASVQRYLHAGDGRFDRARKATKDARAAES